MDVLAVVTVLVMGLVMVVMALVTGAMGLVVLIKAPVQIV